MFITTVSAVAIGRSDDRNCVLVLLTWRNRGGNDCSRWRFVVERIEMSDWIRLVCPDPRCNYAVSTRGTENAKRLLDQHLNHDARHTNGLWIDRDGNKHIGLDDFGPPPSFYSSEAGYLTDEYGSD